MLFIWVCLAASFAAAKWMTIFFLKLPCIIFLFLFCLYVARSCSKIVVINCHRQLRLSATIAAVATGLCGEAQLIFPAVLLLVLPPVGLLFYETDLELGQ